MSIEKMLLVGLAVVVLIAFTSFIDKGAEGLGADASEYGTQLGNIESNGIKFDWK